MADKPSTEDILKKIRQQSAAAGGAPSEPAAEDSSQASDAASAPDETSSVEDAPAKDAPPKKAPKKAPKGTADILAAIRSGKGSGEGSTEASTDGAGVSQSEAGGKPAAKKPSGPAPKGTAGILAAIRSQGSKGDGGAAADDSASPARPAAKKPAAAAPAGDLPPVSEMLERMKAGRPAAAAAERAAPAKPQLKIPKKPEKKASAPAETRRGFLVAMVATPFALAWTLLAGISGVWLLSLARYMFPNVLVEPPSRFKIGPPSDYPPGTVSTKWTAARGIWIVHTDQYGGKDLIYALASVCTHLGCTPSWLEGEQKFKCPCHGSGFYINGINFEGPAPRPLERVGLQLAADGMLEVDKSMKFQEEKGQWEDPKSFVDASLV